MLITGAEIITECLLEQGVDTVFGYPGGAVLNIYDALYKYSDKITHILTAHEQGASHAADGYARSTGKVGVVIATSGPGATNLVTGLATAYMDSIPMVAITGNVTNDLLGRDSFQEVDITGITMPITKHNFIVKNIADLANIIRRAFKIAKSGRPGPVLIDVTKDVTGAKYEYTPMLKQEIPVNTEICSDTIKNIQEILTSAKKPLIYAGGGVILSGADKELVALAEKLDCPVCCSLMGLGGIPASHPLFIGNIGMHGGYETGMATAESDVIITIGARFSDRVAGDRNKFRDGKKIVQFDIDLAEINKNVLIDESIVADLKISIPAVLNGLKQQNHKEWLEQIKQWKNSVVINREDNPEAPPTPAHIIETINSLTSKNDIIVTDVGQHQMWVAQTYKFENPRTFLTSGGLGTMGYGMGAAIGAQTANKDKRVVLFTGDGSFHMNLNELVTVKSYNLPVVIVVMNNTVLGMVRQWQKLFYERRFSQTDPHRATDFVALAKAFGIDAVSIDKTSDVESVLKNAFEMNKPILVDCHISPDANVLPMIPPGKSAHDIITEMD